MTDGSGATGALSGGVRAGDGSLDPIVDVEGLGKVYEPTPLWMRALVKTMIREPLTALDGVDLQVAPGEICAIVGPNGAGKTTLFRILVGLTTPTQGRATVAGWDAHTQSSQVRRLIGWMPSEDRSLYMRPTCAQNLYFHGSLHGLDGADLDRRIPDALAEVGLAAKQHVSVTALSAGMRARLKLARAILTHPRLLILDEPTGPVDPVGAHELLGLIRRVVASHDMAALISSHRLEEIEALRSSVVLLDRGTVRFKGDLDDLRVRWDGPRYEIEFRSDGDRQVAVERLAGSVALEAAHGRSVVFQLPADADLGGVLHRLGPLSGRIAAVRDVPMPLRDLLMRIYTEPEAAPAVPMEVA